MDSRLPEVRYDLLFMFEKISLPKGTSIIRPRMLHARMFRLNMISGGQSYSYKVTPLRN
jgi:hypothetical protein